MEALQVGLAFGALGAMIIAIVLIYLIPVIASWKLLEKANIAGWKCLIPVYNMYLIYKISGMSGWWVIPEFGVILINSWIQAGNEVSNGLLIVGTIVGILALIAEILKAIKLPKAFGKGVGYQIAMFFFPHITEIILGFGKSEYEGDYTE